jgi:hydroxymethylglutaryl-CoA lyase
MAPAEPLHLVEVAPRDGLQSLPFTLSVEQRVAFVRQLVDVGVRNIEVTSFVHPGFVPQHAGAERVCAELADLGPDVHLGAYVPNSRGFDRALKCEVIRVVGFAVGVTDALTVHNTGVTTEEALRDVRTSVEDAKSAGVEVLGAASAAFGCPFTGHVDLAQVLETVDRLVDTGVDVVQIADTIGTGTPAAVDRLASSLRDRFPELRVSWHFHDTFGMGLANATAAVRCGYREFDASVGGIGGCPFAEGAAGNVASEEMRYAFSGSLGCEDDVDGPSLVGIARTVRDWAGPRARSKLALVGEVSWRDQFLSGAHVDAGHEDAS